MARGVHDALNDHAALESAALWIGSYTAELGGSGRGIERVRVDEFGAAQRRSVISARSPSFLAGHPRLPVLYAVEESTGNLIALNVAHQPPRPLGRPRFACEVPCHIHVDPRGRYLLVSGWADGTIALFNLSSDGSPSSPVRVKLDGSEPPRAHCALTVRDGVIATVDIANDSIGFWRLDGTAGMVSEYAIELPPESGPRHLTTHGDGMIYAVTEHSGNVFAFRAGPDGRFVIAGSAPLRPDGSWSSNDLAAEITVTDIGSTTFAHIGVRGSDTIVTMRVAANGTDLVAVDEVSSRGIRPRHHTIAGCRLYVANQTSNSVATFDLDAAGRPTHVGNVGVGSPGCVVTMNHDSPTGPLAP